MQYEIVCANGPMKGRRWTITTNGLKFGRAASCEIRVEDISVDLFHCTVKLIDNVPVVLNLASDNGVDVNGSHLNESRLRNADVISIGGSRFAIVTTGGGKCFRRSVIAAVLLVFLAISVAILVRMRQRVPDADQQSSANKTVESAAASDAVTAARVERGGYKDVVVTNRIVEVVDKVIATNYLADAENEGTHIPTVPPIKTLESTNQVTNGTIQGVESQVVKSVSCLVQDINWHTTNKIQMAGSDIVPGIIPTKRQDLQTGADVDSLVKFRKIVPTKDEIKKVMPKIEEKTRDDFAALNAKVKTHVEVADVMRGNVEACVDSASKYVYLQMAFEQYVLGKAFDKAAELYFDVRAENGIEYALEISAGLCQKMYQDAAQELKECILSDEKSAKTIADIKSLLAPTPVKDLKLYERLALAYVACGDWKSALFVFMDCGGEIAKVAEWELMKDKNGNYNAAKVAYFWWSFAEKNKGEAAENIKIHSASWYMRGLSLNMFSDSEASVANRRVNEVLAARKRPRMKNLYMVVDLEKQGPMAVSYREDVPNGGWGDEYRTRKIVLRRIDPGTLRCVPGKSFKITRPFYIGIFEVTQAQYARTMNEGLEKEKEHYVRTTNGDLLKVVKSASVRNRSAYPSYYSGYMASVEQVSYIDIRGLNEGLNWPKDDKVDKDSYLGKLRHRFWFAFDLPTEVQWEYACRAGSTGDYNVKHAGLEKIGNFRDKKRELGFGPAKVGSFLPNAWGLYDMHGNVEEWCLDRGPDGRGSFDWTCNDKETKIDPKGPAVGSTRVCRGGSCDDEANLCRSSSRARYDAGSRGMTIGFRLVCPADIVR